jgi:hypothetical protein
MEPAGMQSGAKSTWEVVQKLSSDKQQSTFIHEFGNPLGIPFPGCTTLTYWRLMSRKKVLVREYYVRRKGMIHDCPMDIHMRNLWRMADRGNKSVLILVPGSHERLTLRKHVMCAKNMGVQVQCVIWSTKGIKKRDEKLDFRPAKKGAKKLVSSNCAKILEKESSNKD